MSAYPDGRPGSVRRDGGGAWADAVFAARNAYVVWGPGIDHTWRAEADSVVITIRWAIADRVTPSLSSDRPPGYCARLSASTSARARRGSSLLTAQPARRRPRRARRVTT